MEGFLPDDLSAPRTFRASNQMEGRQLKDLYMLEIQDRSDYHEVRVPGAGIGVMPMLDELTEGEHIRTTNQSLSSAEFTPDRDPSNFLPYSHK